MQQQGRVILVTAVLAVLAATVCGRPQTGGRRLLNPIYTEGHKLVGPESHSWDYYDNKPPAVHTTDFKVRSEKPFVDIVHNDTKGHEAKGGHTVLGTDEGKLVHSVGKGGAEMVFNSGKRAFSAVSGSTSSYALPQTVVSVGGGMPLDVAHVASYEDYGANSTGVYALGSGPTFNNKYNMTAGPGQFGALPHPHGRR